jgi:predicted metallopeptidase
MDLAVSEARPAQAGFDFTAAMSDLCRDLTARLPGLAHIDVDRLAVAFSQTRKRVSHGLYATLTPLRFEGGRLSTVRAGRVYAAQRLYDAAGREQLYILRFYMPRFMETRFLYKLTTVVHELWHISPDFDGDLRRHAGRCYAHTHSQKQFDAQMEQLARHYLSLSPPEDIFDFLRLNFGQLIDRYGSVGGLKVRQPKLLPVG